MSLDLSNTLNSDNTSWKDLVEGHTPKITDILLNCFNNENIIQNENEDAVIDPENVELGRMCIHIINKKHTNAKRQVDIDEIT